MARARGEVSRLHRSGDQHPGPDVRHGPDGLRGGRGAADVGAVILELARSEQTYTFQRPIDYATSVLAGAIAAGWRGPVFLQGDHYQFNAKKYAADPEAMTEEIRRACRLAIDAGYRNIDIDSSTLVDLSLPTRRRAAARELRPGGRADRPDPVARDRRGDRQRRRRDRRGRQGELERGGAAWPTSTATGASWSARAPGAVGISKVSVQTGTIPRRRPAAGRRRRRRSSSTSTSSAGSASVARSVRARRARSSTARRPCPTSCSTGSRAVETAEIHLATGFQNALFEHPAFPAELHARDRALVLRERARRAEAGPDRRAVRLHDAEEGDRAVQARALGPRDEGRDPGRPATEDRVPLHGARRERVARDGRAVHPPGRAAAPGSGRPRRGGRRGPPADATGPRFPRGSASAPRHRPTSRRSTASSSRPSTIRRSRR